MSPETSGFEEKKESFRFLKVVPEAVGLILKLPTNHGQESRTGMIE